MEENGGFAYYDVSTDTIHGAKEGTLTYYHEQGHQAWARKGIEQQMQLWSWVVILIMIPFLTLLISENLWVTILSCSPLAFYLISEIHGWVYAFRKYFREKKNGSKNST
jgi:hypothetical protein